jgi:hypothetical protein
MYVELETISHPEVFDLCARKADSRVSLALVQKVV